VFPGLTDVASYHAGGRPRDEQNETCVFSFTPGIVEGELLPQATSYKKMLEAGSLLQTRLRITSLHAEFTLVNLQCGLPEAPPSRTGI
jgi:hypothetical protein